MTDPARLDSVEGWERAERILDAVLELPEHERQAALDAACGPDDALRRQLQRLLRDGEDPGSPLEQTLGAMVAPLIDSLDAIRPAMLQAGDAIGPWRLVRPVGEGGMGEVYLAERADGQFAQQGALKVIRRGREHDPLFVRRFLDERRILASLSHPNIATLLDGGVTAAGLPWFAMEYVEGVPLDAWCEAHGLGVGERLALMEQVLGAVSHAHRNLLVHRDLKPSNILVRGDGQAKLLDFGIAKLLDDAHDGERTRTVLEGRALTPEYAAPEQVQGGAVTTATDVYALGALLYLLLTGRGPHRFARRTASEIEHVICTVDPEPPSVAARGAAAADAPAARWRRRLSPELDVIVLTALQKDPSRRYPSVDALREDLRRYRAGEPLVARPDSLGYRLRKFVGRNRLAVTAGALVVATVVTAGGATWWQARAARLEAARADRVKAFLVDLLHQADPNITQGQEYSVRQLLDRGTARVDSLLAREPQVQSELYEVLGNTYAHLGLAAKADTLHRKGLAVTRRLYGAGSPVVLDQEMAVAWGLNDRGKYADADTLLTRAVAAYRAAGGGDDQALSDALDILATARKRLDKPAEAESLYRASLAMQVRLTGPRDTITASRLSDLASLLSAQNRLVSAESALVAAQRLRDGVLPPLDVRYLVGESSLATIYMKRGKLAEAAPRLQRALAGLERVEGPGGLNLARALDKEAFLLWLQGRPREAVGTGERAVAMFRETMGEDHPEGFGSASSLALYRAAAGDTVRAEREARLALAGLRRVMGERHDLTLAAGQREATLLLQLGRLHDADTLAASLLAVVRAKAGHVPPTYAALLLVRATALAGAHDRVGADTLARAAGAALATGTWVDSVVPRRLLARYDAVLASQATQHAHAPHAP